MHCEYYHDTARGSPRTSYAQTGPRPDSTVGFRIGAKRETVPRSENPVGFAHDESREDQPAICMANRMIVGAV